MIDPRIRSTLPRVSVITVRDGGELCCREQRLAELPQGFLLLGFGYLQISQVLTTAHTHCREKHEVGWYARQTGVSADSLSAMLKRLYGKSASTILSELLAREAKVCLRNPLLSVQQVAEILGFADQSAFGKFFKRHCGMSPGVYRKKTNKRTGN